MTHSTQRNGKTFIGTLDITAPEMRSLLAWREVIAQVENMATKTPINAMEFGISPRCFSDLALVSEIVFTLTPLQPNSQPKLTRLTSPLNTDDILVVLSLIRLCDIIGGKVGDLH